MSHIFSTISLGKVISRVLDSHHFNADPDLAFLCNADPDPNPAPLQSDRICNRWSTDLQGFIVNLNCERPQLYFKLWSFWISTFLMRIRIRIQVLFRVIGTCEHRPIYPSGLPFEPPGLHCERPRLFFKPLKLWSFVFKADPDPAFHYNADPSPDQAPLQSDGGNLCERPRLYFEPLKLLNFDFNANPDPASKNNAGPDPQPW